jgi:hypothetical protein
MPAMHFCQPAFLVATLHVTLAKGTVVVLDAKKNYLMYQLQPGGLEESLPKCEGQYLGSIPGCGILYMESLESTFSLAHSLG